MGGELMNFFSDLFDEDEVCRCSPSFPYVCSYCEKHYSEDNV